MGIYPSRFQEVREIGLETPTAVGMTALPTVTVELGGKPIIFRLPMALNGWADDVVALALSGANLLPFQIEFGTIRDRPYADFVIS